MLPVLFVLALLGSRAQAQSDENALSRQLEDFIAIPVGEAVPAESANLTVQLEGFLPVQPVAASSNEPSPAPAPIGTVEIRMVPPESSPAAVVTEVAVAPEAAETSPESATTATSDEEPVQGSLVLGEPSAETAPQTAATPPDIPAGFEAFFQEQTTQVDVYYGGLYVTSTLATYDPNTLEFLIPDDVVLEIPGIEDIALVRAALSGSLPNNQNARCTVPDQINCGIIYPDVAGVIFDSSRFRADVFIDPEYLALQARQINKYLGPSSAGFSAFQTINYAFSGSDNNDTLQQNLNSRLLFSSGENSLLITGNYSDDVGFELDDLRAQRDWQGMRYEAGFINSYGTAFQFGRRFDILGFSASSSFDTREDLRFSTGNSLEIYLPLQSSVLLYVDGRLVVSQQLPPGNQQLDTTSLPGGSYDVEILVRDASGERTETRFYTKNSQLPPPDEDLYSFTFGYLRSDPDEDPFSVESNLVWQGGYQARLTERSAWKVGIAGTADDLLNQIGWFGTSRNYELGISLAAAKDQRYGLSLDLRLPLFGNVFSTNFRRIWNKPEFEGSDSAYLLGPSSSQIGSSYTLPLGSGTLSMSARLNERDGVINEVYTAGYRLPAWRFGPASVTPRIEVTKSELGIASMLTIDFRQNQEAWQFNGNLRGRNQRNGGQSESDVLASAGAGWRSDDTWQTELNVNLNASVDRDSSNLTSDADWATPFGRARFNGRYSNTGNTDSFSYGGNYTTSIVYSTGNLAFGGAEQNRSAIIIDLTGVEAEGVFFDVLINGGRRATAMPGRRTIVGVSPYAQHQVSLVAQGSGFVSFNNTSRPVTVYPGNAVTLSWDITGIDVVFGRLVNSAGEPVGGVLLNGVEGLAVSGNFGDFQAEISPLRRELTGETRTHLCQIEVPRYEARNGIGLLGDLVCDLRPK